MADDPSDIVARYRSWNAKVISNRLDQSTIAVQQNQPSMKKTTADMVNDYRKWTGQVDSANRRIPQIIGENEFDFYKAISEAVFGDQRKTQTTESLPEMPTFTLPIKDIGNATPKQKFWMAAGMLASASPDAQVDIIQATGVDADIDQDEKGNRIVTFPNGSRFVLNKPGFTPKDAAQVIATAIAYAPASAMTSLGSTFLKRIGIGLATNAATNIGLQKISKELGSNQPFDFVELGLSTGLGAVGELGSSTIQSQPIRRLGAGRKNSAIAEELNADVRNVTDRVKRVIQEGLDIEAKTGIELFPAQVTQNPEMLSGMRFVSMLPQTAAQAWEKLARQNKNVADRLAGFLDVIAPAEAVESGASRFRGAAQEAMRIPRELRQELTSPLYNAAKEGRSADVSGLNYYINARLLIYDKMPTGGLFLKIKSWINPVDDSAAGRYYPVPYTPRSMALEESMPSPAAPRMQLDRRLPTVATDASGELPPSISSTGIKLMKSPSVGDLILHIRRPAVDENSGFRAYSSSAWRDKRYRSHLAGGGDSTIGKYTSIERLHAAKVHIDQLLEKRGENAVGNIERMELEIFKKNYLLPLMDDSTLDDNGVSLYWTARNEFKNQSAPVNAIDESKIGIIAKIKDEKMERLSSVLFSPETSSVEAVRRAKITADAVDHGSMRDLVRAELERRIGRVRIRSTDTIEDIPGGYYSKLFPNRKSVDMIAAALDGDVRETFLAFERGIKRASSGRPGNSATEFNRQRSENLGRGPIRAILDFINRPVNTLTSMGKQTAYDADAKAMADALFDEAFSKRMRQIMAMKDDYKSYRQMWQFLQKIHDVRASHIAGQELVLPYKSNGNNQQ